MASKVLKGLTIQIGGDTSQLLDSLKDVEKKGRDLSRELGEINKLLKLDPDNTELLAQKQKVLSEAVGTTKEKLDKLKEAEKQVQEQFKRGDVSEEQVRALQREIVATEKKLDGYERAVKETNEQVKKHGKSTKDTAEDVEDLADASKEAEKSSEGLGGALAGAAKVGLAAVGAAVGAAIGGLTAAAESTREYRTEMGKLDTAFTQNGFTAEAAYGAYSELQGILGETDQAVEATNHLAQLTSNEKELAKWTGDILPGVYATFGASLPIEGLTEAANETAKVGQVTGPLADALNWAADAGADFGIGLKENIKFTRLSAAALKTLTPEQRAEYEARKKQYEEIEAYNKKVAEATSVEDQFNIALEACSTEQERQALITKTLSDVYGDASKAYKETNEEVIRANKANEEWTQSLAGVGGAIEPILTDVKMMGASLLEDLVPGVQTVADAFRGVLNGDAGAVDDLAAGLSGMLTTLLEKLGGMLPGFVQTIATLISNLLPQVIAITADIIPDVLTTLAEQLPTLLQAIISGFSQILVSLGDMLPELIPVIIDAVLLCVETLLDNVDQLADAGIALIIGLADGLVIALPRLIDKIPVILDKLVNALANNWPKLIGAGIQLTVKLATGIIKAIPQLASKIPQIIKSIVSGLKSGFGKIKDVGKDLIKGLWNGIKDMTSWITGKLKGFGDTVLGGIKDFFGIESPSRVMAKEVGRFLPEGLARGVTDNAGTAVDAMTSLSDDMLNEAEQLNGITLERRLHNTFDPAPAAQSMSSGLFDKLDRIISAIEQGQILTIDGDALVGATSNRMDSALGRRRALAARGAI